MTTNGHIHTHPEDRFDVNVTGPPCPFVTVGCGSMRVFFYPDALAALESLVRAATEARDALAELAAGSRSKEKKP